MRGSWTSTATAVALLASMMSPVRARAEAPLAAPALVSPETTDAPAAPESRAPASALPPPAPAPTPPALPGPLPPAPPPALVAPARRYGDRGTPEIAVGLGYSSLTGFLAAAGFRYFVLDGVAPGVEASYVHGATDANAGTSVPAYGLVLATLRLVPLRTPSVALALTGRAGRMLVADHGDGWGAGGGAALLLSVGSGAALELGYELLWLSPSSFCADLWTCTIQGPVIGVRIGF